MHQTTYTGIDGRDHRRRAHSMNVDLDAGLGALVDDRLEYLDLRLWRSGLRRQSDLTRVLDSLRSHRLNCRTRFGWSTAKVHSFRRNNARAVEFTFVDPVSERDVAVARPAAGQDRRVPCFEKRLHLRLLIGACVDVLVAVDEAGHGAHALGINHFQPLRVSGACRNRYNPSATHDDRAGVAHLATADDASGG